MKRVGRYDVVRSLAKGGMGEVLLGRLDGPAGFARPVVLKRVRADAGKNPRAQAMLLDEARLTSRLSHPNIAQGIDLVEEADGLYLVMEFVDGIDFGRLLRLSAREDRPPDVVPATYVAARVACALHFAHHAVDPETGRPLSVIHRDVTPSNVLLSRSGEVKLADFGVAKADTQQVKTAQGTLKGKVGYLSPEQCRLLPLDGRSDVFSLGIVLHESLSLARLFRESNPMRAMERICDEAVPPPSSRNPQVPQALDAIVLRALEKDPDRRFESAGAFQQALEEWLLHQPPTAESPERKLVRWIDAFVDAERTLPAARAMAATQAEVIRGREAADTIRVRQTSAIYQAHAAALEDVTLADRATVALSATAALPLPRFSTPHVGRAVELAAMRAHFQHGGAALAIVGERGIGKSRLAVEFCRRLRTEGARRPFRAELYLDASATGRLDAFNERLADILSVQLHAGDDDHAHLSQLAAALSGIGDVLVVVDGVSPGPVVDALLRLREKAPLLRLVVVSRDALDLKGFSIFRLRAFSDDSQCEALFAGHVRELVPDFVLDDVDREALTHVLQAVAGHPQSIALLAGVAASGRPVADGLREISSALERSLPLDAPDRVVAWALSNAGDTTNGQLALVAAFGGPALASELQELEPTFDGRTLHALVRRGFLRLVFGPAENAYAVSDVVKPVVRPTFDDLAKARSITVNRAEFAVKLATQRTGGDDARAYLNFINDRLLPLAEQALLANDPKVAARLSLVALRRGATSVHATALLDRIAHALGDDNLGVRLEIALGHALAKRGKQKGASRVLAHATAVARSSGDNDALALALLEQGRSATASTPAQARAALDEALELAVTQADTHLEERIRTARAQLLTFIDQDQDAYADLERARSLAHARGSRSREGKLALAMAALADRAGRMVTAGREAKRARQHLEASGDSRGAFEATLLLGHVLAAESQYPEAKRAFSEALSVATQQGDIPAQVRVLGALAAVTALAEGPPAAQVYLAGIDALQDSTPSSARPTVDVYRSIVAFAGSDAPVGAVQVAGADAMAARLLERIALGDQTPSSVMH